MVSITVDQSINTDDVNVANGTPAFIVKVTNNATERTYQDIIVYEKEEKSREAKEQHFTKSNFQQSAGRRIYCSTGSGFPLLIRCGKFRIHNHNRRGA